jgi:hypothetical protein
MTFSAIGASSIAFRKGDADYAKHLQKATLKEA